ncbi:hypothetical protein [Frigoriflavimonas asaccharolytica]|uniref:Uncharacterized protein n=1 Tax=Frigoriflavimonas asaccharolytica TaxID=2735899 RepID=A0A8J8G9J3_9FLAO|nr:hypothetical protein [Frigoriflavimonas asaccharolytica]NRS93638.1 hypothetical protein [Frigoriflavimonas asaccharolytica]
MIYKSPFINPLWQANRVGAYINNPNFTLVLEEAKTEILAYRTHYIRGIVSTDGIELYDLFKVEIPNL